MTTTATTFDSASLGRAVAEHIMTALMLAEHWQDWMMPAVSDAVDAMIARGDVPIALAEAFDDVGQFFMRVSTDIFAERERRGLPLPDDQEG